MAGGLLGGLLGAVLGSTEAPKTDTSKATSEVESEEDKAKRARAALLEAGAGGQGQLAPGQVAGGGDRVFGN